LLSEKKGVTTNKKYNKDTGISDLNDGGTVREMQCDCKREINHSANKEK